MVGFTAMRDGEVLLSPEAVVKVPRGVDKIRLIALIIHSTHVLSKGCLRL